MSGETTTIQFVVSREAKKKFDIARGIKEKNKKQAIEEAMYLLYEKAIEELTNNERKAD